MMCCLAQSWPEKKSSNHVNGLLTILDRWEEAGKVRKTVIKGKILWQLSAEERP